MGATAGPIGAVQAALIDRWIGEHRFTAYAYGFKQSATGTDLDIKFEMASGALSVGTIIDIGSGGGLGTVDQRGAFITYRLLDSEGENIVVGNGVSNVLGDQGHGIPFASLATVLTGQNSSESLKLNLIVQGTGASGSVQVQADRQYRVIPTLLAQEADVRTIDGGILSASAIMHIGMSMFFVGSGFPNTFRATSIQVGIQTYSVTGANKVGTSGEFNSRWGDTAGQIGFNCASFKETSTQLTSKSFQFE
jgi:hypothetical protein